MIAYLTMLLVAGLPMFFLELYIGQYSGVGPAKLFGLLAPGRKGLGYSMVVITSFVTLYYNMIMAWALYYTAAGLTVI